MWMKLVAGRGLQESSVYIRESSLGNMVYEEEGEGELRSFKEWSRELIGKQRENNANCLDMSKLGPIDNGGSCDLPALITSPIYLAQRDYNLHLSHRSKALLGAGDR